MDAVYVPSTLVQKTSLGFLRLVGWLLGHADSSVPILAGTQKIEEITKPVLT